MKRIAALITIVGALCTACAEDPIYNTTHPAHGRITLTTNWDNRTPDIPLPDTYFVQVGTYLATLTQPANVIDNLFLPDTYPAHIYTLPNHIHMEQQVASVATLPGTERIQPQPGWLFSCIMQAEVKKDTDHYFTAVMQQQMRRLTLVIQPTGGTANRITRIAATLTGVASQLNLKTGEHAATATVEPQFALGNDGKYRATLHLLGTVGNNQTLDIALTYNNNTPDQQMQQYNLATLLAGFNNTKETPLTLEAQVVETPTEAGGFAATITDWTKVTGTGTAN